MTKQRDDKVFFHYEKVDTKYLTVDLWTRRKAADKKGYTTMRGAVLRMKVLCKVEVQW